MCSSDLLPNSLVVGKPPWLLPHRSAPWGWFAGLLSTTKTWLFGKRSASGRRQGPVSGGQVTEPGGSIHRHVLWVGGLVHGWRCRRPIVGFGHLALPPLFQRKPRPTPTFRLARPRPAHFRLVNLICLTRYLRRWVGHAEVPRLALAIAGSPMLDGLL